MLKDKNKIKKESAKLLESQRSHFEPIQKAPTEKENINSKPIDPDVEHIMKIENEYRNAYQNKFKTNEKSSYITYDSYNS